MSPPRRRPRQALRTPNRPGLVATVSKFWPYLWPHGRPDLQRRVFLAFGLLLVAKAVTMVTPFAFKWTTDALVAVTVAVGRAANPGGNLRRIWLWRAPHPADGLSTA